MVLSFRQAIVHTQQDQMMDESEWASASPRLDTMFWKSRTTETGPGITFHGISGNAGDYDVHLRRAGAARSVNGTSKRGVDHKHSTIITGFRISLGPDIDISSNSGTLKGRPKPSPQENFVPTIASEGNSMANSLNGDQKAHQYIELTLFPTQSTISPGSVDIERELRPL